MDTCNNVLLETRVVLFNFIVTFVFITRGKHNEFSENNL